MEIRRQLTLFLQNESSEIVEKIRKKYNPKQFELIKAHVTLCREDEIENLDQILTNIASLKEKAITIRFEKLERFDNGKGVYLKSDDAQEYHKLRQQILKTIIDSPREQTPHITLMHPRNSICDNEIFEKISTEKIPLSFTFSEISLIEQEKGEKWKLIKTFRLTN
ncbi:MAG: hypothetical protein DI529_01440 [Chryseobacterium sp.]|nr:MAG: hypothetical protein DI529_01440 [Chryseobacterium sp.]